MSHRVGDKTGWTVQNQVHDKTRWGEHPRLGDKKGTHSAQPGGTGDCHHASELWGRVSPWHPAHTVSPDPEALCHQDRPSAAQLSFSGQISCCKKLTLKRGQGTRPTAVGGGPFYHLHEIFIP